MKYIISIPKRTDSIDGSMAAIVARIPAKQTRERLHAVLASMPVLTYFFQPLPLLPKYDGRKYH